MTISELQQQVGEWNIATFGPIADTVTYVHQIDAVAKEAKEFDECPIPEEAADVIIALLGWAHRAGVDLESEVLRKFEVVKSRDQLARAKDRGLA